MGSGQPPRHTSSAQEKFDTVGAAVHFAACHDKIEQDGNPQT
jgi:hypothetical protein